MFGNTTVFIGNNDPGSSACFSDMCRLNVLHYFNEPPYFNNNIIFCTVLFAWILPFFMLESDYQVQLVCHFYRDDLRYKRNMSTTTEVQTFSRWCRCKVLQMFSCWTSKCWNNGFIALIYLTVAFVLITSTVFRCKNAFISVLGCNVFLLKVVD